MRVVEICLSLWLVLSVVAGWFLARVMRGPARLPSAPATRPDGADEQQDLAG